MSEAKHTPGPWHYDWTTKINGVIQGWSIGPADKPLDEMDHIAPVANPRFIIVFQEKDPPHLITVIEIPGEDVARATVENRKARSIFKRCTDEDHWPGYTDDKVLPLGLPYWARVRHDEDAAMGVYEISKLLHEPLPGQAAE